MTVCYFVQIGIAKSTGGPILKAKHMIYMENEFYVHRTSLRYMFGLVCGLLHHLFSLVWIYTSSLDD
jgi:hypothetical protein